MSYKEFEVDGVGKVKIYKRRSNRSLKLTVAADGSVRMTMPLWAPYQAGLAFMNSKRSWILAQNRQQTDALYHGMQVGKSHRLLFRSHDEPDYLKTNVNHSDVIVTHGGNFEVADAPLQLAAQDACVRALRRQARSLLGERLEQLSEAHNISYAGFTVKRMKSRWGSCDQRKNIVLNLYLVQLPWELIDYVILHELTHTRVLNHGPDFWGELERLRPDAKQLRRTIRTYRPTLLVS